MYRDLMNDLVAWKHSGERKPLIIRGARQVGKTWLMHAFGEKEYAQTAYINFESAKRLRDIFREDFDINRILLALQIETGIKIGATDTLIILDEIQEAPEALTALKYFQENAPEYHIISAGSLLGVALHRHTSFPVGKVRFLDLCPLSFSEYLAAIGEQPLLELLQSKDHTLIRSFRMKYIQHLKTYYYTGGMPEAVSHFSRHADLKAVREIQLQILAAYEQDFSKHAPYEIVPRIRMLWNSIPAQLARENKKFMYGIVKEGARARDYELALSWLTDCGLLHRVARVSKPGLPLKAYSDHNAFKLFPLDVGLLCAQSGLDARTLLEGNRVFTEFKGALTEQFVLQQLLGFRGMEVYYWSAEGGQAEVDFLIRGTEKIVPVEVKAEENLRAKSLRVYYDKYHPAVSLRLSMSDYREDDWLTNLPLYAIPALPDMIA